ncbi:radical SAM protein [Candidatus Pacearchaeota archaeon]|nr:radical SAM protein [Candidatus Pacearchaeota archaeon]
MSKVAVIHITDKCNLRCPHCLWASNKRTNSEMSMDEYKTIISYLKTNGYNRLLLQSEGEALMHSQYREMFDCATENGLRITKMITNGLLLDKFVDIIKLCQISISLDGYTPEKYAEYRGGTIQQFNKLIDNIKLAVSVVGEKKVVINYVITSENYMDVESVIRFCETLGVGMVRFHQYNPVSDKRKVMILNERTRNYINNLLSCNDFNINIKFNLPGKYDEKFTCNQLLNDRITIGLSGYVTPCCHIHSDKKYGTFNNHNNSMTEFKDKFISSTKVSELPVECQRCPRLGVSSISFNGTMHSWDHKGIINE